MDGGDCQGSPYSILCLVGYRKAHGVTKSRTGLSDFPNASAGGGFLCGTLSWLDILTVNILSFWSCVSALVSPQVFLRPVEMCCVGYVWLECGWLMACAEATQPCSPPRLGQLPSASMSCSECQ